MLPRAPFPPDLLPEGPREEENSRRSGLGGKGHGHSLDQSPPQSDVLVRNQLSSFSGQVWFQILDLETSTFLMYRAAHLS